MSEFIDLKLDERLLKALNDLEFKVPTPIQQSSIPKILEGLDLFASAHTGTGKTAAFMLPSLNILANSPRKNSNKPGMLVLVPTRELAMQVASVAEKLTKYLPFLKVTCIFGGSPYPPQRRSLSRPYDILVATPGRLMDHMQQGLIDLSQIKLFVLDEADRMLDMGFIADVEHIASFMPKTRQTLLFSATLDKKIISFSKRIQSSAFEIREEAEETKSNIDQRLYYADNFNHKITLLEHILDNTEIERTIIFTTTKKQAEEISVHLRESGHLAKALHGNMNQKQRTLTIANLRKGKFTILVATDVASRGIDIPALSHVINIDLPEQPEDYVHRIGRTARAGAKGTAISFATYQEEDKLLRINKLLGNPINSYEIEGKEPKAKTFFRKPGRNKRDDFKKRPFSNSNFKKRRRAPV